MRGNIGGCREPSVDRCLNCEKPECNVVDGVPLDRSEIIAQINAGMLPMRSLVLHDQKCGRTRKRICEVQDEILQNRR